MRSLLRVPPLAGAPAAAHVVHQIAADVHLQIGRAACKWDYELVAGYRRGLIWPVVRVTKEPVADVAEAAATEAAECFADRAVNAGPQTS